MVSWSDFRHHRRHDAGPERYQKNCQCPYPVFVVYVPHTGFCLRLPTPSVNHDVGIRDGKGLKPRRSAGEVGREKGAGETLLRTRAATGHGVVWDLRMRTFFLYQQPLSCYARREKTHQLLERPNRVMDGPINPRD
jgi:hypothetical protein